METFTDKELKNLVRWTAYTILYAGYICVLVDYLIKVYHGDVSFDMNTALCIRDIQIIVN